MPATGKAKGGEGYELSIKKRGVFDNQYIHHFSYQKSLIICNVHELPSYLLSFFNTISITFMHIIAHLFMQDPKNNSATSRKPWYQRAMEIASLWKTTNPKSPEIPSSNPILKKNLSTSTKYTTTTATTRNTTPNRQKLRKSTSLKVATSFTRVCLCVPISSYTEVFQAEVPPRRSNTYPRSKPFPTCIQDRPPPRLSTGGGRRIFRGKSLTDDVLMRRFVVEEEAMMQERRRNEMEVVRKRNAKRRRKLGPSPLSRMVLAEEEDEC